MMGLTVRMKGGKGILAGTKVNSRYWIMDTGYRVSILSWPEISIRYFTISFVNRDFHVAIQNSRIISMVLK